MRKISPDTWEEDIDWDDADIDEIDDDTPCEDNDEDDDRPSDDDIFGYEAINDDRE